MGLMSVVSHLGAASAPWVAQYLSYSSKYLPFIVMGSLSIVSAELRETNGMAMAETLEDFYGSEGRNTKDISKISCRNQFFFSP